MQMLRADTAATIMIGPFVDKGDGVTPEEGVALGTADSAELMKHDGTSFVDLTSDSRTFTHKEKGMYTLVLGTGDTDTEGRLTVFISDESVCLPVWKDFMVMNAPAYDALYASAGTDYMPTDVTQIAGSAVSTTTAQLGVNAVQVSGSGTAADNVEAVFLGTGDTGDVDLAARSLKLNSDTDVALEILSSDDSAIKAVSSASGKHGMELQATAAGGDGLNCLGNTTGDGFHLVGGATGHGISTAGGSTSGQGIFAAAQDGNGNGILCRGDPTAGSTGDGFRIEGGTDGHGIHAKGGSGAGAGIYSEALANNDAGMELVKHGTGKDIDADEIDTIDTNVDSVLDDTGTSGVVLANDAIKATKYDESTAFPIKSADTGATQIARVGADGDTLETLSDEIAAISAAAIADAVWDEDISGHETALTAGRVQSAKMGEWEVDGNQLICKGLSGTVLFTFDLTQDGAATEYNPDKRTPV